MVSEPDYDPNSPGSALDPSQINRLGTGVFEMGSTFKAFTVAMGLDAGMITLNSMFDVHSPLRFGKFEIHDFELQNCALSGFERSTPTRRTRAPRALLCCWAPKPRRRF